MDALDPNAMLGAMVHDVKVVSTKKKASARVMGVPPEEFGIERGARSIRDANYCFHEVVTKTEGDLIAEGFDEDQIKALTEYTGMSDNIEAIERDTVLEHQSASGSGTANSASRLVKITEHYVRMDYEGKGRPKLYQVTTGGDQGNILKKDGKDCIVPFDAIPFAAATPVPQPHRFFGRSIADLVLDIQRIKTALLRGALDNLYLHNAPRPVVSEAHAGPNTIDDILTVRQGAPIRMKQPGGIEWQTVPDITGSVWPAMEYVDSVREMRTGVTRQSQGVDANALQNQSATAVAQAFSMSQQKMKLIAKIIAETGVRDLFMLLHGTIRKHGQQAETVRLRNQWVSVDPRDWKARNDMTINVGLGTGGKAERFAHLMAIANLQKEAVGAGKTNLVDDAKLYNSASQLCKILDYKNPDQFFNDPAAMTTGPDGQPVPKYPAPPPQPNPDMIKAQGQLQIEQTKAQNEAQLGQMQAQADAQHQAVKTQSEAALAERKAELETKLMLIDAQLKERADQRAHEAHMLDMHHKRELHQMSLNKDTETQNNSKANRDEIHGSIKNAAQQLSLGLDNLHQKLNDHVASLAQELSSPAEIVRDPKTGRAVGVRKGSRQMTIHRGPDGRATGLQ